MIEHHEGGSADRPARIAVIPARGGSKRVPGKNVRDLNGLPALEWTVRSVRESGEFDRIVVSTDSPDIASCAVAAGAEVPFPRPSQLGTDHVGVRDVMRHAVEALVPLHDESTVVGLVYPTAVLLDPTDIRRSLSGWAAQVAFDACLSVTSYPHPIDRAMSLGATGQVAFLDGGSANTRTQDSLPRVHDAAQFCWATAGKWRDNASMLDACMGYLIPAWRAVDIDTEDDWVLASLLHTAIRLHPEGDLP